MQEEDIESLIVQHGQSFTDLFALSFLNMNAKIMNSVSALVIYQGNGELIDDK